MRAANLWAMEGDLINAVRCGWAESSGGAAVLSLDL